MNTTKNEMNKMDTMETMKNKMNTTQNNAKNNATLTRQHAVAELTLPDT